MRLRVHFHKTSAMRYTGHLDLHKTWERAFRRAGLPLAYSQGFHPQPKISLACALPLGFTSQAELLDAWLEKDMPVSEVSEAITRILPPGIRIETISEITGREPALQVQVQSAVYEITLLDTYPELNRRLEELLSATTLPRERRGKQYDLRPLVDSIRRIQDSSQGYPCLQVQLAAREAATGRPEELLQCLGVDPYSTRVHRTQIILSPPQSIEPTPE